MSHHHSPLFWNRDADYDPKLCDIRKELTPAGPPYWDLRDAAKKVLRRLQKRSIEHVVKLRECYEDVIAVRNNMPSQIVLREFVIRDAGTCLRLPDYVVQLLLEAAEGDDTPYECLKDDQARRLISTLETKSAKWRHEVGVTWGVFWIRKDKGDNDSELLYQDLGSLMELLEFEVLQVLRQVYDMIDGGKLQLKSDMPPTSPETLQRRLGVDQREDRMTPRMVVVATMSHEINMERKSQTSTAGRCRSCLGHVFRDGLYQSLLLDAIESRLGYCMRLCNGNVSRCLRTHATAVARKKPAPIAEGDRSPCHQQDRPGSSETMVERVFIALEVLERLHHENRITIDERYVLCSREKRGTSHSTFCKHRDCVKSAERNRISIQEFSWWKQFDPEAFVLLLSWLHEGKVSRSNANQDPTTYRFHLMKGHALGHKLRLSDFQLVVRDAFRQHSEHYGLKLATIEAVYEMGASAYDLRKVICKIFALSGESKELQDQPHPRTFLADLARSVVTQERSRITLRDVQDALTKIDQSSMSSLGRLAASWTHANAMVKDITGKEVWAYL
ncbi:hypothetical protein EK21DRAFT_86427 [Setomelanomma holmii]|uniref:Uncharacterized protein n=1 Tax=Setomelanomma holmii TaxID=210430 RepID=A0A9P4HHF2_9PLEO|nr:hypothetical protein EK21DRAFT_86427 [Setomelanomma holmii]